MGSCKSCVWLWQWLLKAERATMLTKIDLINPSSLGYFFGVIRMDWTLLDSFYWGLRCSEYWQFMSNSNYVGSIIKWNIVITDQVWLCYFFFFFLFWVAVTGTLKGYDQLLNLVLDEAIEFLRGSYFMAYWQLLMRLCVCIWF